MTISSDQNKATDDVLKHLGDLALQDHEMLQAKIANLKLVMRHCCDAIRENDEFAALRMLEVALRG